MSISIQLNAGGQQCLLIDGRVVRGKDIVYIAGEADEISVSIWHSRISEKITKFSLSDLPKAISKLELYYPIEHTLIRDFEFHRILDGWDVWVELRLNGEEWKNRWTIREYCGAIIEAATEDGLELQYDDDFYGNGFHVQLLTAVGSEPIHKMIQDAVGAWKDFHARVVSTLDNAVIVEFNFPQEIRVACEQYLQYFGQFLHDLGVETETTVNQHEGRTILSSRPMNKTEALGRIREALNVYLQVSVEPPSADDKTPIEAQRLLANIHHLHGQLALAKALLEAKNATIAAQEVALKHVQFSPKSLVADIAEPNRPKTEAVLGGIVILGETEPKYGVSFSWAEFFRRMKKSLRGDR